MGSITAVAERIQARFFVANQRSTWQPAEEIFRGALGGAGSPLCDPLHQSRSMASTADSPIPSATRQRAAVALLDDSSPVVEKALLKEFGEWGSAGLDFLRRVEAEHSPELACRARYFREKLIAPNALAVFQEYIKGERYDLETGAILLNRVVNPGLDPSAIRRQLDAMGARCRELLVQPDNVWHQCKVLNRVLFHEMGFRGNLEHFDDPLNCFIEQVLRRRMGIPISLSLIYLMVARRAGLVLEPVGMPGRFLIGCFTVEPPFFIDAFERGGFRSVEELREILRSSHISKGESYLWPVSVGEVLCRCCRNLARQYDLQNNPARARQFAGFVREFDIIFRRQAKPERGND